MQQPVTQVSLTSSIKKHLASASAAIMIAMLIMTSSPGLYARAAEQPAAVSDFSIKVSSSPAAALTEGVFYGSPINGIRLNDREDDNYKVIDGSVYTADGKTLFVYFPTELNEDYEYEKPSGYQAMNMRTCISWQIKGCPLNCTGPGYRTI